MKTKKLLIVKEPDIEYDVEIINISSNPHWNFDNIVFMNNVESKYEKEKIEFLARLRKDGLYTNLDK